jgi:choline dehydrogenase-like flavoprotein
MTTQQGNHYDAIIVGSGAGGSAAAYKLARRGARVLLLEKGPQLPVDGSTMDVDKVMRQGIFKSKEPWLDKNGMNFVPEEYFNLGGKTKWYGAALLRFGPQEFEDDAVHQCLPWPIRYQELIPYYQEAEKLLGVREFEPEPDVRAIVGRMTRNGAGWQVEPLPLALSPDIVKYPHEARHSDAFASVAGLKSDGQQSLLAKVKSLPNLEIRTEESVSELLADVGGAERVQGVISSSGRVYRGANVMLAAGALHSPRLLLDYLDTTRLGTRLACAGIVGRNYKHHVLTAVVAISPSRKTDLLRKTVVLLNQRFPHSSVQPLGFDGELISLLMPRAIPKPLAHGLAERAYGFFLQTEDGSDQRNRVTIKVNGTRKPQLDYDAARLEPAISEHRQLVRTLQTSLLKAGMVSVSTAIPLAGTAHACGPLATDKDPSASGADGSGKVPGMSNFSVVDGSILPRSSRVNPSLTIYAWALRVAERMALPAGGVA